MRGFPRILLAVMLTLCLTPTALAESEATLEPLAYSRYIDVPGVGPWYYYAQNDPEWGQSYYEPRSLNKHRRFHSSGCGPSCLAIALNRQLTPEELVSLLDVRSERTSGYRYCACSVNYFHCYQKHEPTYVVTPEDFLLNLPRVLGAYASGNNRTQYLYRNDFAGTSVNLFPKVAEELGLDYIGTSSWDTAREKLLDGYSVITTVTKGVFTNASHYLVVASIDDSYIYLLDPWMRTEYELDRKQILEIVEPGLLRTKLEHFDRLGLHGFYMLKKPDRMAEAKAE